MRNRLHNVSSKVLVTENLESQNPRNHLPHFEKAKLKYIKVLVDQGTWKVILCKYIPDEANFLKSH